MVVAADGSVTEVTGEPAAEYDIWSIRHIPATGEAVVEDSGGAYALDAAGAVRRITAGDLVAVGQNHLVVHANCNEALVCIHFRIDAVTGDRQLVVVPDFEQQFRGYDPTISVSPDGSMMTYLTGRADRWNAGWCTSTREPPRRSHRTTSTATAPTPDGQPTARGSSSSTVENSCSTTPRPGNRSRSPPTSTSGDHRGRLAAGRWLSDRERVRHVVDRGRG